MLFIQERKPLLNMQSESIRAKLFYYEIYKKMNARIQSTLFKVQILKQLWKLKFHTLENDVWNIESSSNVFNFDFSWKSLVIIDLFAVDNDCLVIADIFQSNDPSGERLGKCNIIL